MPLWDLDDILSYNTYRVVRIRDRRLGLARLVIWLAAIVYVVGIELIVNEGFLSLQKPSGAVRLTLRDPGHCTQAGRACRPDTERHKHCNCNNIKPLPVQSLSYCSEKAVHLNSRVVSLPCLQHWDYHEAVYPAAEENAIFLSTRVNFTIREGDQQCMVIGCPNMHTISSTEYFVPNVENYTLWLGHSMFHKESNAQQDDTLIGFTGSWVGLDGKERFKTDYDTSIEITDLLELSGFNSKLDKGIWSQSYRYNGLTLLVFIEYSSAFLRPNAYQYKFYARFLSGWYENEEVIWDTNNGNSREYILNRHGIRIVVVQGGQVGSFAFVELLKTIASILPLLGLATLFIDKVLLKILPCKYLYEHYKNMRTVDFSDVKKLAKNRFRVKNEKEGTDFEIEAHDFVMGTLVRGGEHGPEWSWGNGLEKSAERIHAKYQTAKPNINSDEHKTHQHHHHQHQHNNNTNPQHKGQGVQGYDNVGDYTYGYTYDYDYQDKWDGVGAIDGTPAGRRGSTVMGNGNPLQANSMANELTYDNLNGYTPYYGQGEELNAAYYGNYLTSSIHTTVSKGGRTPLKLAFWRNSEPHMHTDVQSDVSPDYGTVALPVVIKPDISQRIKPLKAIPQGKRPISHRQPNLLMQQVTHQSTTSERVPTIQSSDSVVSVASSSSSRSSSVVSRSSSYGPSYRPLATSTSFPHNTRRAGRVRTPSATTSVVYGDTITLSDDEVRRYPHRVPPQQPGRVYLNPESRYYPRRTYY